MADGLCSYHMISNMQVITPLTASSARTFCTSVSTRLSAERPPPDLSVSFSYTGASSGEMAALIPEDALAELPPTFGSFSITTILSVGSSVAASKLAVRPVQVSNPHTWSAQHPAKSHDHAIAFVTGQSGADDGDVGLHDSRHAVALVVVLTLGLHLHQALTPEIHVAQAGETQ